MKAKSTNYSSINPSRHLLFLALFGMIGVMVIFVLSFILKEHSLGEILLDRKLSSYPFTIQNLMHLVFFIGLGELFVRWKTAQSEMNFIKQGFLPEDEATVLQSHDLGPIRKSVKGKFDGENGFLPSLIDLCVLQFQGSHSVDQTVSVLNSSLELMAHRVELRYQILRYISWAIPTFGFIGTVFGISGALQKLEPDKLKPALGLLATAFNTTLIALILSAILVFIIHMVQKQEERSLNLSGNYCLRNLINRLYVGK